jgi:hypothetical protein
MALAIALCAWKLSNSTKLSANFLATQPIWLISHASLDGLQIEIPALCAGSL